MGDTDDNNCACYPVKGSFIRESQDYRFCEGAEGGRALRLYASHNYLAIYCSGKVKGSPEKQNLHTILKTFTADEQDPGLVYIYGVKAHRFIAMDDKEGGLHGVTNRNKATVFREDYARNGDIVSENYLTYECITEDKRSKGWYIALRANGMIRRGSHTTQDFINELIERERCKCKDVNKIRARRQSELMFLPDVNVSEEEVVAAETNGCEECTVNENHLSCC